MYEAMYVLFLFGYLFTVRRFWTLIKKTGHSANTNVYKKVLDFIFWSAHLFL